MNGGVLAFLGLEDGNLECTRIPRPIGAVGWTSTSIAAHDGTIVVLDRTLEGAGARVLTKE